jgi:N-methylhydantoinase B
MSKGGIYMSKTNFKLNQAEYEVFFNKLDQAANESQQVLRYLSASSIVRESGEALEAFYLPSGEAVDIASGILMHFMNVTRGIRYMNENNWASDDIGIYDGDQFLNNDAYIGGMHCPDMCLIAPFYYHGELLGYAAAISHTSETGGIEPGGMCPSATEAWHDGIIIPLVKIIERGKVRRDVMNMFLRGTRDPRTFELDLKARMAGNERAIKRLQELVDEFGVDFFKAAALEMVEEGKKRARARFKELRPGKYSARTYCDTLKTGRDKIAVVQVDVEVTEDGSLIITCPVISPQQPCFNNAYLPAGEATVIYTLLTQILYDARWNSGVAEPIKIDIPFKSRMNADASQSVGYATVGIATVFCAALCVALSRAYFVSGKAQEVQAGPSCSANSTYISGKDYLGRPCGSIILSATFCHPGGGRIDRDGSHNYGVYNPWNYIPDSEGEEALVPILHLWTGFLPDSAGPGKNRSANNAAFIMMIHNSEEVYAVAKGVGGKMSGTQGIFGGYAGPRSWVITVKNSDVYERIKKGESLPQTAEDVIDISKNLKGDITYHGANLGAIPCKPGDVIIQSASGGAGLGDPIERDPERVLEDFRNGLVTLETCHRVYCVSLDTQNMKINSSETEAMRQNKIKDRLKQGIPGDTFLKTLVARREKREFSQPVLEFLDEIISFSPAFKEQTEREKKLAHSKFKPLGKVQAKRKIMDLTPYVKIIEDDKGRKIAACSKCDFAYSDVSKDYKLYCLIYERDPAEVYPKHLAPDKDWALYREFYCPQCGTQIEAEQCPPCMPIIQEATLNQYQ